MKKLTKIAIIPLLALASIGANAELISTDWLIDGDAKATLDTASGLEWLDLSLTNNMSYNLAITGQLAGFEDWRVATHEEVTDLFTNIFPDAEYGGNGYVSQYSTHEYAGEIALFKTMFGTTATDASYGFHLDGDTLRASGVKSTYGINGPKYFNDFSNDLNTGNGSMGIFLVSEGGLTLSSINNPSINIATVPVPATLGMLGLVLSVMSFRRKKQD